MEIKSKYQKPNTFIHSKNTGTELDKPFSRFSRHAGNTVVLLFLHPPHHRGTIPISRLLRHAGCTEVLFFLHPHTSGDDQITTITHSETFIH